MHQIGQPAASMFTHIIGYAVSIGDDEQQAFELLKKNCLIPKPLKEEWRGKGIFRHGSRLQTFHHKMKFPE